MDLPTELQLRKYNDLLDRLKNLHSAAIAFSGGVDSTLLLYAAHVALEDQAKAVTVISSVFPASELQESESFCRLHRIPLQTLHYDPLSIKGFSENPPDRCYWCKRELFGLIQSFAKENALDFVAEGSNIDDMNDYRPGLRAIAELGIVSPLKDAGLTKSDIRVLSAYWGLPTADKPSYACLASRFAYGEKITAEGLIRVERAEQLLRDVNFKQLRVRVHGTLARIEVPREDLPRLLTISSNEQFIQDFKSLGFSYITADLQGYRTGSMNETLI